MSDTPNSLMAVIRILSDMHDLCGHALMASEYLPYQYASTMNGTPQAHTQPLIAVDSLITTLHSIRARLLMLKRNFSAIAETPINSPSIIDEMDIAQDSGFELNQICSILFLVKTTAGMLTHFIPKGLTVPDEVTLAANAIVADMFFIDKLCDRIGDPLSLYMELLYRREEEQDCHHSDEPRQSVEFDFPEADPSEPAPF